MIGLVVQAVDDASRQRALARRCIQIGIAQTTQQFAQACVLIGQSTNQLLLRWPSFRVRRWAAVLAEGLVPSFGQLAAIRDRLDAYHIRQPDRVPRMPGNVILRSRRRPEQPVVRHHLQQPNRLRPDFVKQRDKQLTHEIQCKRRLRRFRRSNFRFQIPNLRNL